MVRSMRDAQLDFLRDADGMTRLRGYLQQAASRYGISELATRLKLDESTLRNQLDWRKRQDKTNSFWRPSAECVFALLLDDRRFREDVLALNDERIEDVEVITAEDFAREVVLRAKSKKYGEQCAEEITQLYQRVKKERR